MKKVSFPVIAAISASMFLPLGAGAETLWVSDYMGFRHNDGCQYFKQGGGKLTENVKEGSKDCAICGGAVRRKTGKYQAPASRTSSGSVVNDSAAEPVAPVVSPKKTATKKASAAKKIPGTKKVPVKPAQKKAEK